MPLLDVRLNRLQSGQMGRCAEPWIVYMEEGIGLPRARVLKQAQMRPRP
jgi:hypothetical protein